MTKDLFFDLVDRVSGALKPDEVLTAWLSAETTDFVRFNRGLVRQPGHVSQAYLSIDLINGQRHATAQMTLSGDWEPDRERVLAMLSRLRAKLPAVPVDPHLLYNTNPHSTASVKPNTLAPASRMVDDVLALSSGLDLVGLLAAGEVQRGFANSLGQKNWFSRHSFNFDSSLYLESGKAVKACSAGFEWHKGELQSTLERARAQLSTLDRPPKELKPGRYAAYLAPAAVRELMGLLGWGGFSLKSHRTKRSPLLRMATEGALLSEGVSIREASALGAGPTFQSGGFIKPDQVELIQRGRLVGTLNSPRSAREYGVETNAAQDSETPSALFMEPGTVNMDDVSGEMGEGLYIGNLWYLNYSDRPACRVTGMTRFATFWVEKGKPAAPVDVMRFDETLYRMLGENLTGLTRQREFALSELTYEGRSTDCSQLPGALVQEFTLTL